jgi:hypothetical protein
LEGGDGSQANCSRLGGRRSRHTAKGWPRLGVDAARFRLESSPFPPKIGPPIRESRSGTAGDLSEPTGRAYPEVERIIRPNWMRMPHPANKNSRRLPAVVHPNILEGSRVQCWTVCRLRINSIPHPRFERGLNDPERGGRIAKNPVKQRLLRAFAEYRHFHSIAILLGVFHYSPIQKW